MSEIGPPPEVHIALNPARMDRDGRAAILADPVFGEVFTDHMVTMQFRDGRWEAMELSPFGPLQLSPATLALHYGQSIFEALKAYRLEDGTAALFRPGANATRMAASAERIAMPTLPDGSFELACALLVEADRGWIPGVDGSALYVRPFMFASEPHLSVRPAAEYMFVVIACPVAAYFGAGIGSIAVAVESSDVRATPGGTGAAKFAGNYAAGFAAHGRASDSGHDQVLWLDAVEHQWVEELNAMNVMFVWERHGRRTLTTPPLTGTILEGVTRDSLLQIARDSRGATGVDEATEAPTSVEMIRAGLADGSLVEMFACGTAAVIAPIGELHIDGERFVIGTGSPGSTTLALRSALLDIQHGRTPDAHGWMSPTGDTLSAGGIDPSRLHQDAGGDEVEAELRQTNS